MHTLGHDFSQKCEWERERRESGTGAQRVSQDIYTLKWHQLSWENKRLNETKEFDDETHLCFERWGNAHLWHSGSFSWGEGLGRKRWKKRERKRLLGQLSHTYECVGSIVCAVVSSIWRCVLLLKNQSVISITVVSIEVSVSKCWTLLSQKWMQFFQNMDYV